MSFAIADNSTSRFVRPTAVSFEGQQTSTSDSFSNFKVQYSDLVILLSCRFGDRSSRHFIPRYLHATCHFVSSTTNAVHRTTKSFHTLSWYPPWTSAYDDTEINARNGVNPMVSIRLHFGWTYVDPFASRPFVLHRIEECTSTR